MSSISVWQKTMLPAPIIATFAIVELPPLVINAFATEDTEAAETILVAV
jgi:hypothetical protein